MKIVARSLRTEAGNVFDRSSTMDSSDSTDLAKIAFWLGHDHIDSLTLNFTDGSSIEYRKA